MRASVAEIKLLIKDHVEKRETWERQNSSRYGAFHGSDTKRDHNISSSICVREGRSVERVKMKCYCNLMASSLPCLICRNVHNE